MMTEIRRYARKVHHLRITQMAYESANKIYERNGLVKWRKMKDELLAELLKAEKEVDAKTRALIADPVAEEN